MGNYTVYQISIILLMICFFFTQSGNENINLDKSRLYIVVIDDDQKIQFDPIESYRITIDLYKLNQKNIFKNFEKNLLKEYINDYSNKISFKRNSISKFSHKLNLNTHYIFSFENKIEDKYFLDLENRLKKYFKYTYNIELRAIND
jgi:hypothetical protein